MRGLRSGRFAADELGRLRKIRVNKALKDFDDDLIVALTDRCTLLFEVCCRSFFA
jgi:hypothetical protein